MECIATALRFLPLGDVTRVQELITDALCILRDNSHRHGHVMQLIEAIKLLGTVIIQRIVGKIIGHRARQHHRHVQLER